MKFKINKEIFTRIEPLNIGIIICRDINNNYSGTEIKEKHKEMKNQINDKFSTNIEELADYTVIRKWRDIYKGFGEKKNRSSVEALIRRIVNGNEIQTINPLVDLYNLASLKFEMPCGGEDLDRVKGDIELTIAEGNEEFISLGETEVENPNLGEIIYKFNNTVICRNFNYRESDLTKLTEETKNAVIVFEDVNSEDTENLEKALEYMSNLLSKYLGGTTKSVILNKDNNEVEI